MTVAPQTKDVVVLFGGSSSERLVSVASAQNVSRVLPEARLWFLGPDGRVFELGAAALATHERPFELELTPDQPPRFESMASALDDAASRAHVFFIALHGGEGENGTLQALFERRGVAFTGSGAQASADAFDKAKAKTLAGAQGVRLAQAEVLPPMSQADAETSLRRLFTERPRWVLKPVADGSSSGLVHLQSLDQVGAAAETLAAAKVRYLAEEYIAGRELTVGVVDEAGEPHALPVSEVRLAAGASFDYLGKYLGRGTEEITPAALTPTQWEQAQRLAVVAHQAVGCFGYSRTDMILDAAGPVFLETNTLPGLTRASFIPQQLAAAGKDFAGFLQRQLELARQRQRRG